MPKAADALIRSLVDRHPETALAVLLPIVAGQGGSTGAQALAVVMRGLALREVLPETQARLLRKELQGAFLNGVAVALVTAGAILMMPMLEA